VQENSLPQITKLIDSYEKSNEKLTAAGQRLAAELKKLGDKSDNQWGKPSAFSDCTKYNYNLIYYYYYFIV
jgi:hypothetical protein